MTETDFLESKALPPWPEQPSKSVDGMLVFDAKDFRVVSVNPEMLRLLRASSEQVWGRTWQELADRGLALGDVQIFRLLTPSRLLQGEFKTASLPTSEEERSFVELDSYPLSDTQGRVREVVFIARDVSLRKRFESDLNRRMYEREVAHEFTKALQRTVDLDEVLYVTLVGVTAQQGLQFNRAFLFLYAPHTRVLEGQVAIGPFDSNEARVIWGELSETAWTLSDLLSAYDSNQSLADSKLSAQVRQLCVPLSQSGCILMKSMLERKSFNMIAGVADDGSSVDQALAGVLGSDTFAAIPLYTRQKDIGVLVVDNWINKKPITANQIKLLEIFGSLASSAIENSQLYRDLKEKVKAVEISRAALEENQERLLRAERLSAVGKMAATVAHEIRNPLVSIGGFARLLKQQFPLDDPRQEDVEIIISETMRLEKIVANILQYSYAQQAQLQPTDIHGVINKTLDILRREIQERKIVLNTEFSPGIGLIEGDPAQLMQVFYNLIINAIQALDVGGNITVTTERVDETVLIRVKDTGCGIAAENLERIFTPFFSTKRSGAGLGLAVVTEIIDAHGGNICVSSEEGKGTEFFIRLPVRLPTSGGTYGGETNPDTSRG